MKQGWEIKKLGEVCAFQRGLTYSKDDEVEHSNNCVLRSNNIDLDSMSIVLDELKYINDDFVVSEDKKVKPNTILICMSNGSKQHIGKVAFIDKEYGYAFGGFMGLIKPNTDVSPKFIYYSCISSSYKHFLAGIGNGANITNLKFSDLQQYTLPVPPREEQERIVAELDCLSSVIERKREQLRELDALAQSIFFQMFGDPITNEKGWGVIPLKQAALLKAGKAIKANELSEDSDLGLYPCYGGNGIRGYINKKSHNGQFPIIGRQGALCGNVVFAQGEFYATEHAVVCNNIIESFNPLWLYYALKYNNLNRYAQGVAQPGISVNIINEMPLIYPPLILQQEFADKIKAIEKQKELIKQSITQTEELFNARMDYYFN